MSAEKWGALVGKFSHVKLSTQLGIMLTIVGSCMVSPLLIQNHWIVYGVLMPLAVATTCLFVASVKQGSTQALEAAKSIAEGDFSNASALNDTQDGVLQALNQSTHTLGALKEQIAVVEAEHAKGNTQAVIDVNSFNGE